MANGNLLQQNIIGLLGLEALPNEEKIALLERMTDIVQKRVLLRVMEELPVKEQKKLAKMGKKQPEEIMAYIEQKMPNFEPLVEEEILKLKKEMINVAEEAVM